MKNIELFPKEAKAIVSINPKIFPLEVIYAAAYVLLDKAYFIIDGDPEKDIRAIIRAKNEKAREKELEGIALQLHDELINYATYMVQAARNQAVREAIIKRALATNVKGEASIPTTEEYYPEYEDEPLKEKAGEIKMPETALGEKGGETKAQEAQSDEKAREEDLFIKDPEGIAEPWTPEKAKGLKKPGKKGN